LKDPLAFGPDLSSSSSSPFWPLPFTCLEL
jgi:hypothetical protein